MNLQASTLILVAIFSSIHGWECTKPGRFRDPAEDESSCQLYVTCIPNSDGTFTLRNDECSSGNLFSEKYQRCISGESCNDLEDFYSIEYECKECGKFVNVKSQDCRQFINCLKTKDPGVFVAIKQNCPKDQVFSAKTLSCVDESEYQCPPVVLKFLSDFVCLDVGRYPDESVPNCLGYRKCSKHKNGTLISENFLCKNGTIFSETERKCVPPDSYECPDDGDNDFQCPGVGRYPDKVSKTCETYHNCVENSKGEIKAALSTCPGGTIFSAITSKCVSKSEYVCPTSSAELELVEQHSARGGPSIARRVADDVEATVCTESGRFANEEDELCETYFLCSRDLQGDWLKVKVRCPSGSVFSPERKRCVDHKEFSCPRLTPDTNPTTTTVIPQQETNFECVGAGRAPNPQDTTCRSYILCSLNSDNELTRAQLSCPYGSIFSTVVNKCVKNDGTFQCPGTSNAATEDAFEQSGDDTIPTAASQTQADYASDADVPSITESFLQQNPISTVATFYEYPCTATGRFADINSIDCRSYFLCTEDNSGSIVSVHLFCPSGMVFSRNDNKCVVSTKYLC